MEKMALAFIAHTGFATQVGPRRVAGRARAARGGVINNERTSAVD